MPKSIYISYIDEWVFNDLRFMIENTSEKKIDVYIFSQGGSIDAGFAMAHYIEGVNKNITTHILGNVSSAATLPFLAGKKRKAVKSAYFMGHNPSLYMDVKIGSKLTDEQIESAKAQVEFQRNRLIDYYEEKINMSRDEIETKLNEDIFLTAEEMENLGIVTEIVEQYNIAAYNENFLKQYTMNIFNKNKVINDIALSDDIKAVYEGDLKEGVELRPIGSTENINGEFVVKNKIYNVENNKIVSIEDAEKKPVENSFDKEAFKTEIINDVKSFVSEAVNEIVSPVMAKFEAIEKESPKHTPPKRKVENKAQVDDYCQAISEIKKSEREHRKEVVNKNTGRV